QMTTYTDTVTTHSLISLARTLTSSNPPTTSSACVRVNTFTCSTIVVHTHTLTLGHHYDRHHPGTRSPGGAAGRADCQPGIDTVPGRNYRRTGNTEGILPGRLRTSRGSRFRRRRITTDFTSIVSHISVDQLD